MPRSLGKAKPGFLLILDDLAAWREVIGGGKPLSGLLGSAVAWTMANKGLFLTTGLKPAFDIAELAELKDEVSISLDIAHSDDSLVCTPVALRGRYPGGGPSPFGFRIPGRTGGKRVRIVPVQDFESSHGERIRSDVRRREEIAQQLFTGPLGASSLGLWVSDLRGSFGAMNDRMRTICAIPTEEGDRLPDPLRLIAGPDRRAFLRFLARARKTGEGAVTTRITPSGQKSSVVRVRAVGIEDGLTAFLVDTVRQGVGDGITDEGSASPRSAFCRVDRKKIHSISPALRKMLGPTTAPASPVLLGSCFSQKTVKLIRQWMDLLDAGDPGAPFLGALRDAGGAERPVRVSIDAVRAEEGQFVLTVEDVSEFLVKITALEHNEGRFRSITEGVSRPVALADGLKLVYVNPALRELAGIAEEAKVSEMTLDYFLAPEDRPAFTEAFGKFLASRHVSQSFEAVIPRTDLSPLTAKLSVRKIQGAAQAGLLVELEDITEQRREAARLTGLHEGVEKVASILEAATSTPDYNRLIHVALDRSLEILGWTGGAVYIRDAAAKSFRISLSRHIPKKLLEQISEVPAGEGLGGYVAKTLESHILSLDKYPSYLPFGRLFREHGLRWVSLVPLVHNEEASGFILGLAGAGAAAGESSLGTLTTLGRQLGNALANARNLAAVRESEGRLHTVVESLSGIVYTAGPDGTILTIDAAVASILGYSPRDFSRNKALFLSLIHEADKKVYLERVTAGAGLGSGFVREYRMRPKAKAAFRWMRDTVSVMRDPDGAVQGFTGILADVTADREKFDAVLSEHTILRTVQDVLPEGIAVFDDGGACVDWNPVMERLTGTTRAAALGRRADTLVPLPPSLGPEGFAAAVSARKPVRLGLVSPAGEPSAWYELFLVTVPGRGDAGPGFLLRYADVTARQAELDNLLQSEKILLNVINAMDDVMMITDLNGRVVEVNQAFLKVMRYPRSAAVGQEFPYPWLVEKDMSRFLLWISRIREQQWLHDFDVTWLTRGGEELQMSLNTTLIRNSLGEPVAMLNIARDITERVSLGREIEARTNQLEMINRIVTLANLGEDFAPVFRAAADEIVRLMPAHAVFTVSREGEDNHWSQTAAFDGDGLTAADALRFIEAVLPAGAGGAEAVVIGDLEREFPAGGPEGAGARFRSAVVLPIGTGADAASYLAVASREPHAFGEEHAAQLRPVASQLGMIIGRIRLFRQVLADSTFVARLLDSIENPVYTVDRDLTISRVNRAAAELFAGGLRAGSAPLVGTPLFERLPASALTEALGRAFARISGGEERNVAGEVTLSGPSGPATFRLSVSPLGDGAGSAGYVISHTDITSLKAGERELRERADQLITLHEISAVISNTFDIGKVLASSLSLLKDSLRARGIIVYLVDPRSGGLVLAHQEGFDPGSVGEVRRLHPELSITGNVVQRKRPRYIASDVAADGQIAPENRRFLEANAIEAMAVVPILSRDEVLGALDIFYAAHHEFPDPERHLLNLAGNQLGAAIVNVRLYEELRSQVDRLSALFDLSSRLTSLLNTGEIYREVFDHVKRVVPCERCTISVLAGTGGVLVPAFRASREGDGYRIDSRPESPGGDASAPADLRSGAVSITGRGGTAVVPMASDGSTIGAIEVTRADGLAFDEVQVRLLESFGSLAAIAVQKAGLYEETLRTTEKVEQRNRELDDFTYVVSHDLKEPLISIEGFSRILQLDYSDVIRSEGREYLDSLVGAATRMKGLIDDLLMLSRVSRPTESFGDVDLTAVVEEVRSDMEFLIRKKNVDLRVAPGLPVIRGNGTQLSILFRNLIGNAVKFNDKPAPQVEVGFQNQGNNSYLFWVRDNGIGIEPEFFEKIFVIFQRLHRREEFEGSGAGLAIVRKIIEIHQGSIRVESRKGEGSTFFFTLPASATA